jgi:hypothetical protein
MPYAASQEWKSQQLPRLHERNNNHQQLAALAVDGLLVGIIYTAMDHANGISILLRPLRFQCL